MFIIVAFDKVVSALRFHADGLRQYAHDTRAFYIDRKIDSRRFFKERYGVFLALFKTFALENARNIDKRRFADARRRFLRDVRHIVKHVFRHTFFGKEARDVPTVVRFRNDGIVSRAFDHRRENQRKFHRRCDLVRKYFRKIGHDDAVRRRFFAHKESAVAKYSIRRGAEISHFVFRRVRIARAGNVLKTPFRNLFVREVQKSVDVGRAADESRDTFGFIDVALVKGKHRYPFRRFFQDDAVLQYLHRYFAVVLSVLRHHIKGRQFRDAVESEICAGGKHRLNFGNGQQKIGL